MPPVVVSHDEGQQILRRGGLLPPVQIVATLVHTKLRSRFPGKKRPARAVPW